MSVATFEARHDPFAAVLGSSRGRRSADIEAEPPELVLRAPRRMPAAQVALFREVIENAARESGFPDQASDASTARGLDVSYRYLDAMTPGERIDERIARAIVCMHDNTVMHERFRRDPQVWWRPLGLRRPVEVPAKQLEPWIREASANLQESLDRGLRRGAVDELTLLHLRRSVDWMAPKLAARSRRSCRRAFGRKATRELRTPGEVTETDWRVAALAAYREAMRSAQHRPNMVRGAALKTLLARGC